MRSAPGRIGWLALGWTVFTSGMALAQTPVSLLTTQDPQSGALAGWKFYSEDPQTKPSQVWKLDAEGVLSCQGSPKGYLATEAQYTNFTLRLEWRWQADKPGKGGVLIRKTGPDAIWPRSLEAQINAGDVGDFWGLGGFGLSGAPDRMKVVKHPQFGTLVNVAKVFDAEKPAGQWNQYEIVANGDTVTLTVNGLTVNRAKQCDVLAGPILLTAEGTPYQFRRVQLIPAGK